MLHHDHVFCFTGGYQHCHCVGTVVVLTVEAIDRHYDVISAPLEGWSSDPFSLSGRNGYFYGRGVTDNKGPILATACAAAELLGRRQLGLDLVFLIEGEEETGSSGFGEAVRRHKVETSWLSIFCVLFMQLIGCYRSYRRNSR